MVTHTEDFETKSFLVGLTLEGVNITVECSKAGLVGAYARPWRMLILVGTRVVQDQVLDVSARVTADAPTRQWSILAIESIPAAVSLELERMGSLAPPMADVSVEVIVP